MVGKVISLDRPLANIHKLLVVWFDQVQVRTLVLGIDITSVHPGIDSVIAITWPSSQLGVAHLPAEQVVGRKVRVVAIPSFKRGRKRKQLGTKSSVERKVPGWRVDIHATAGLLD
ncbi:MAG: hypothetical protein EBR82_86430 [Caulobacteraceae bacterium]|nr:hypothetical protein [Caulobacteraceae bacterium]